MSDDLEFALAFDPLSVVPESRIRAPFPQIRPSDARLYHCQMGSTAGNIATLRFTPEQISSSEVRTKNLRCSKSDERAASSCEFYSETAYHLNDPANFFRIDDSVDKEVGLDLMARLARGDFESAIDDFPPNDWPERWYSEHVGRFLSLDSRRESGPDWYSLWLPGCGCSQILVFHLPSTDPGARLILVDQSVLCV